MAVVTILRILLLTVVTKSKCGSVQTYNNQNVKAVSQFGELLKPPPPPLSKIIPVPFHGGAARSHRQTLDAGYHYQPPPPPPPPPLPPSSDFKFPAPFYKQYNFNFVPPPQPFTTTPSPSLFQKVSGWLFSSPQSSYGPPVYNNNVNTASLKKDCNPCNLVPWIPVIRYDLPKQGQQNLFPTYGPPSPTAYVNFQNVAQFKPQPFQGQRIPHAVYGPPFQSQTNTFGSPSSTYGPPLPTTSIASASRNSVSPTYSAEISSSYGIASSSLRHPSSSYGVPSPSYGVPSSTYAAPSSSYDVPSSSYAGPSPTYGPPAATYGTPSPIYETNRPVTAPYEAATTQYPPTILNNEQSHQHDIGNIYDIALSNELQLPKVTHPSGFKNSYGEPITNTYALDIPYSVSATAAEATKIQEEIIPNDSKKQVTPNASLALSNPAPFTLNRGRNIHTLQPVALPNLSVSPLPPIFNARPFRPLEPQINTDLLKDLNYMQKNNKNNVHIEQSLPIAEYTHSVDYPPTIIKSPIIDIDTIRNLNNQTKAYRNIVNGFTIDEIRDISSQASEDHLSATKSDHDSSFESTGSDFGNDLYDNGFPTDMKSNSISSNHKNSFTDLRGVKDEDVDKFRTESNLQNIDSPLLYLKPSAPHKDFGHFLLSLSTPSNENSYEIYDEVPSTAAPQHSTQIPSSWEESKTDYNDVPSAPSQEEESKPKIVQIIVPYTTSKENENSNINFGNIQHTWTNIGEEEYQARKIPTNTEVNYVTNVYTTVSSTTEDPQSTVAEFDSDKLSAQAILNDLYDVKEPPFDIIKLQHTIDDWTEQEYTKQHKSAQKGRTNNKYAKQIPDEYFTTINPISYYNSGPSNFNYEYYDHEGASSNHHVVTDKKNKTVTKPNESNTIEETKGKHSSGKNEEKEVKKPHIYTAASSFRSTTTTPAPWGKIQTSISPLTKEKVYVVTSKPWRELKSSTEKSHEWYDFDFESKKTPIDSDTSASDNLQFQSPRFSNHPSFGFATSNEGKIDFLKPDSSYGFSKSWHQSINELEGQVKNSTSILGGPTQITSTNNYAEDTTIANTDEGSVTTTTVTVEPREDGGGGGVVIQ